MRQFFCGILTVMIGATAPLLAESGGANDPASEPAVVAVGKVWPAVVNVNTEHIIRRTYQDPYDQLFNQFFGGTMRPPREMQQKVQSLGSGFLVGPTGYIVTNEHVVERAADMKIHVTMSDGKVYEAHYITGDPSKDIALLKVDATDGKAFPYISLEELSPDLLGETVLALGNPLGYGLSVSRGIVSALKRSVTVEDVEYKDLVQTDAAINPGNSGGPLIDVGGKLVGVDSVKMSFTPQGVPTQGIGFAIPATEVRDTVREFMKQGSVGGLKRVGGELSASRKLFGLQLQDLTADLSDALGVPDGHGVLISDVDENSSAHDVGIRPGMVIVKVGRYPVNSAGEADMLFAKANSGDEADLTLLVTQKFRGRLVQTEQAVAVKAR
jgi:S1-C subfamily serine protease